jgi:hypothetical protein
MARKEQLVEHGQGDSSDYLYYGDAFTTERSSKGRAAIHGSQRYLPKSYHYDAFPYSKG